MKEKNLKNIAIFHCGFIYSGGGERIVLEEARGLKKLGYNVEVYAPTLDANKCYPQIVRELGVKTFFPSYFDKLPLRDALRMVAASILAPILAINFRKVDVFVGANQPGVWIAFVMAKVLRKPYVIYLNQPNRVVHPRPVDKKYGWYTTVRDYQVLYKLFQYVRPIISWLDNLSITHADSVLVNGSYIGGIIENVYSIETVDAPAGSYAYPEKRLMLKPNAVFQGVIKIGKRNIKKPYALITNRHDPQKRFDYVISALKRVVEKHGDVRLVIPGPETMHTRNLKKLAHDLKISDKVIFTGQIKERELQALYRNAAIYCYPSPEEDFGLGPLEAGGWGVPTVAWNNAGPTVTVKDKVSGFLAIPFDVDDYADKIYKLLKNPKLRSKMGKSAWERTRSEFSWEKHNTTLEKAIKLAFK